MHIRTELGSCYPHANGKLTVSQLEFRNDNEIEDGEEEEEKSSFR